MKGGHLFKKIMITIMQNKNNFYEILIYMIINKYYKNKFVFINIIKNS